MFEEIPVAVAVALIVLAGLWGSNALYDRKVPHYVSRKLGHAAGGAGFLICTLAFSSVWWPLALTASFGLLLYAARRLRPDTFRGVGGSGRSPSVMSEVWFAWVAVPVFTIGWGFWGRPLFALASLLFMAWGDCVTGLVRSKLYGKAVKGVWGSVAMFFTCLGISYFLITPLWLGLAASFVATVTEWSAGDVGILKWADDNWMIPVTSLITLLVLNSAIVN